MGAVSLYCPACGRAYDPARGHFACPAAGDGGEHILDARLDPSPDAGDKLLAAWRRPERDPLMAFASLGAARQVAGDEVHAAAAASLQAGLARFEGRGVGVSPLLPLPELARAVGLSGLLAAKDETGQPGGSHKVRHLAGTMLWLEALRAVRGETGPRLLAISSCGNAALAAACVARASGYSLRAFVPEDVHPEVAEMLRERGTDVVIVPRRSTGEGDPCYLAFRRAVRQGAAPFCCSGRDNWANIEGGRSLGYEAALQWLDLGGAPDHLVLQVGGGALARAVAQAFETLHALDVLPVLPAIHACQTQGAFPLARAHLLLLADIARMAGLTFPLDYDLSASAARNLEALVEFQNTRQDRIAAAAAFARREFHGPLVQEVLRRAVAVPGRFMWPWDGQAPHSLAHGILDDETYDWFFLVRAMLRTGGHCVVVDEPTVARAAELVRTSTPVPASATGASGLAGLLALRDLGIVAPEDRVGLFFTGIDR